MLSKKTTFLYALTLISAIVFSYLYLDKDIAGYFLAHTDTYEPIGDFLSLFGESHWYIGTGVLGFIFFKYIQVNELYKNKFLFLFYINIFSGLMSLGSKFIFGRIRPWGLQNGGDEFGFLLFDNFDMGLLEKFKYQLNILLEGEPTYLSFPSGHATTIFAMYMYLSILFPKLFNLWLALSIIFASARILDNDHFLSDILGGALVGTLSTLYIYSKMRKKIEKDI